METSWHLYKGGVESFKKVSKSDEKYPEWFSEGKTSFIPKEGEFLSENQIPITCLNTMYKWFASCLLATMDQHLDHHGLIEGQQRRAKPQGVSVQCGITCCSIEQ